MKNEELFKNNENGITLIALVITIIVLLILAGVTISMGLFGDNGIITRAKEAKFKQEVSQYIEELQMYSTGKQLNDLQNDSSNPTVQMPRWADANYIQDSDTLDSTKTIKDVITSIKDEYIEKFLVLNGKLYIIRGTATERERKWAKDLGIEDAGIDIENGVLLSTSNNAKLLVQNGTLIIPSMVDTIDEGVFSQLDAETVIIPSTVKAINKNAFAGNTTLKKLIIESNGTEGVKTIGERAFYGCSELEYVEMGDSVTTINSSAFIYCTKLKKVEFSDSLETIGSLAFYDCSALEEFDLPNSLKTIKNQAFQGVNNKTSITLPAGLEELTSGTSLPTGLTSIDTGDNTYFSYDGGYKVLYKVNTSSEKLIMGLANASGEIKIRDGVTEIVPYAFSPCKYEISIVIPNTLAIIGQEAFANNVSKTTVDGENPNFSSDTDGNFLLNNDKTILYRCNLTGNIEIPDGVVTIKRGAFKFSGIMSITLPDSFKNADEWGVFPSIKKLELPNSIETFSNAAYHKVEEITLREIDENSKFYMKDEKFLCAENTLYWAKKDANLSDLPSKITTINAYACMNMSATTVNIPNTIKTIGGSAFYYSNMETINIPESVTTINGEAFTGASALRTINIAKAEGTITGAPWSAVCGNKGIIWTGISN